MVSNCPTVVPFTETDHPLLRPNHGKELTRTLITLQCDFLAKWCSHRENTNSYFYLQYRDDPVFRQVLCEASGVDDSPIYEALEIRAVDVITVLEVAIA